MKEYALMVRGEVVTIITTARPLDELRTLHMGYDIVPLDDVPYSALRNYEYWGTRP